MKIRQLLLTLFLFAVVAAQAQSGAVSKSYYFAKPVTHGREMKDLDGNKADRRDTSYFLIIQVKGTAQPVVSSVSFGGRKASSTAVSISAKDLAQEVKNWGPSQKALTERKGYSIWKIELSTTDGNTLTRLKGSARLIINGIADHQKFSLNFLKPIYTTPDIAG